MTHLFCLPTSENFSPDTHFAANLRPQNGALTPCGCPRTLLPSAGARNFRLESGQILSVGPDMHTLYIEGREIGSLSSPFGALLPGGLILTTNGQAEWIVNGSLCGAFQSGLDFTFTAQPRQQTQVSVEPLSFSGTYQRSSGTLTAKDSASAASALRMALKDMEQSAADSGLRLQPVWVAWQIKDADSRVIARSEPVCVADFQCLQGFTMPVTHSGTKLTAAGSGVMTGAPYSLHLSMERCPDDWKRAKAARLEVYVGPQIQFLTGAQGVFEAIDSSHSALVVAPTGSDAAGLAAAKASARTSFASQGRLCLEVNWPLEGFEADIPVAALDADQSWGRNLGEPHAIEALCAGSATFLADAERTGVMLTALSSAPTSPVGEQKVASGRILRICTPAGGGGGWNYGRYHLLVFATDGIYAVSADRSLSVISSTLIHQHGISRPDAVAVSANAIYCATTSGQLLRIKGSTIAPLELPFTPVALCSVGSELWVVTAEGNTLTINSAGGICRRTDCAAVSFSTGLHPLAVDTAGALRDLAYELPLPTAVEYRAPLSEPLPRHALAAWHISSPLATDLRLSLHAHSGATPVPVVTLKVQGQINAPIRARVLAPCRPYATLTLAGSLAPTSKIQEFKIQNTK